MPARSERLYIFPYEDGEPCRSRPFPYWWDRSGFFKKYERREIDCGNPIDANYAWLLSAAEAIAFNNNCVEQFSLNCPSTRHTISDDMHQLESELKNARWVIVESYEWESGFE